MNGYSTEIKESSRQLTAKERIALKDTSNCEKLDEATKFEKVVFAPEMYAIISVHNEKSDDKDYEQLVVIAKDGAKYVTGSESFKNSFLDIFHEMEGEEEDYEVVVYRMPSRNFQGRDFLTCSIIA